MAKPSDGVSFSSIPVTPGQWRPVLRHLFQRYHGLIIEHRVALEEKLAPELVARALAMCSLGQSREGLEAFQEDKANRWLGFVQGVLTVGGAISVDIERDLTRPLFHQLHGKAESIDVGQS